MKRYALLCLGLLVLAACRKDDIVICDPGVASAFAEVTAAAPPTQTFTFDLGQPHTLRTSRGTIVRFAANAFVLPDGSPATGTAKLRVRELHTVGEIFLAGLHTNLPSYRNQLLVSAGEFNLQAWQGTVRLRWRPVGVATAIPGPSLSSPVPRAGVDTVAAMFLWNLPVAASGVGAPSPAADSSGWRPVRQGTQSTWNPLLQSGGYYTALLPLDSISWINFDQYWQPTSSAVWSSANVQVPGGATETRVYVQPLGYTSLSRTFPVANSVAAPLWTARFPNGTPVQVIVLQARDGKLYFGTERYTWQAGLLMTPPLQELTAAEIVQRVRQL